MPKVGALQAVERFQNRASRAAAENRHHDVRRLLLVEVLKDAFDINVEEFDLETQVVTEAARGRVDLLYRRLVFEVKRDLDREQDDVERELTKYLEWAGVDRAVGLATDGRRFDAYHLSARSGIRRFASIGIAGSDPVDLLAWLDTFVLAEEVVVPTVEDVLLRFGPESPTYVSFREELEQLWDEVGQEPAVRLKRAQWAELLRIVYGTDQDDQDLYLRHTYLATVARLFAFLALTATCPAPGQELGVLDGRAFERAGITNFVDEDFFTWIEEPSVADRATGLLRALCRQLSVYTGQGVNQDLLKHLYEVLVDPSERHDLGEYYTPDWLATLLLEQAGYRPGQRVLDPACGSGTFLFAAIQRMRLDGLEGPDLVRRAEETLAGFEVHPLAVTVARANFLLALGEDARDITVRVPIWMANALARADNQFGRPLEIPFLGSPRSGFCCRQRWRSYEKGCSPKRWTCLLSSGTCRCLKTPRGLVLRLGFEARGQVPTSRITGSRTSRYFDV